MSLPTHSVCQLDPEPKEPRRFEGAVGCAPADRRLQTPVTASRCCAASYELPSAHLVTPAHASEQRYNMIRPVEPVVACFIGPMIVRKDVFRRVGGFNQSYSQAG